MIMVTERIKQILTAKSLSNQNARAPWRWLALVAIPTVIIIVALLIIQPWRSPFSPQIVLARANEATSGLQSYRVSLHSEASGTQPLENSIEVAYSSPDCFQAEVNFNGATAEFISIEGKLYRHDNSGTGSEYYTFPAIPSKQDTLDLLDWLTDLETLPDVQIDGVDSLHLRGKMDLQRLVPQVSASPTGQSETQMLEQLKDIDTSIEIWIGKDDYLIRRFEQEIRTPVKGPTGDITDWKVSTSELRYFDFNAQISVEAPLTDTGELLPGWELMPNQTAPPRPQATPGPLQEFPPTHHFQIAADEAQLELIADFWGEDIGIIEFLEAVCPEVVQELPEPLLSNRSNVPWPGETLNWGVHVTNTVLNSTRISITEYADNSGEEILEIRTYDFYFYVGKESEEHILSEQVSLRPGEIYEFYAVSIYIGD